MTDLDRLRDRLRALPDDRLARMIGPERALYSPEALVVAEVEAEDRGVRPAPGPPLTPRRPAVPLHPDDAFDAGWDRFTDRLRSPFRERPGASLPAPAPGRDRAAPPGPAPYAALGGVGTALRWLSIAFAAVAVLALGLGTVSLVLVGPEALIPSLIAAFWSGLGALVLFGGSEVVRLALDVEARTRHLAPPASDDAPPAS